MLFETLTIQFDEEHSAKAIRGVSNTSSADSVLKALEIPAFTGVIVLVVGAGSMSQAVFEGTIKLFTESLAPEAEKNNWLVIDGGTKAGGMEAMGIARAKIKGTFPLIGVAPETVSYPDAQQDAKALWHLDPNHSHFILVAGNQFGAESPLLNELAGNSDKSGCVIVVDGRTESTLARLEIPGYVELDVPLILMCGSGGLPDQYADKLPDYMPPNTKIFTADFDKPESLTKILHQLLD